jgi:opacity protein-like surface antigen
VRKLLLSAILIACSAQLARAQSSEDYKRFEVFGGYSHNRVDTNESTGFADVGESTGFHGLNASVVGNVARRVGLKFDVSAHFKRETEAEFGICVDATTGGVCFTPRVRATLYNFLGGVQFKDNATAARVKPFAHLLVGAAHASVSIDDSVCREALGFDCLPDESETGISGAVGGGLDIRLSDRFDFRAVQLDYNPTRLGGETQHNFRVGLGIVIH